MKIIVCMKQVPATTQVEIDPETGSPWKPLCVSGKKQEVR